MLQKLQEKKELKRNAQGRKAYLREINVEILELDMEKTQISNLCLKKFHAKNKMKTT